VLLGPASALGCEEGQCPGCALRPHEGDRRLTPAPAVDLAALGQSHATHRKLTPVSGGLKPERSANAEILGSRVAGAVSDADAYSSSRRLGGQPHVAQCGWFWAWAMVGAAAALGAVSLGPIALAPSFIAVLAMSRSRSASRSAFGLLAGAGLLSLFVAFVQRDGPGTTCRHTASASGCDQHLNPVPWLVAGIVLVAGGVVAQARRRR
jgi:hypothetical protein